jgi:4-amino-4-deoxy-L-arabinose transferase-like glycosyltransferase
MPSETRWIRRHNSSWTEVSLVAILLFAGLFARVWQVQDESVWYDEHLLYHNLLCERSLGDFFVELRRTDPPITPVYFAAQYYWTRLVGVGVLQLRVVSIACSLAAAALLYALVRRMFGVSAALFALLLACLSNLHVYYGQEIRVYAFLLLLATASMYGFHRAWHGGGKRWHALHYGASALMLLTHLFAPFLLVAQGVYLLILHGKRPWRVAPWALGHLPAVLLLGWWITTIDHQALDDATITDRGGEFFRIFIRSITWDGAWLPHAVFQGEIGLVVAAVAIGGLAWSSWQHRNAPSKEATPWQNFLLLACWLIIPPFCLLLLSAARDTVFNTRYMLFCSFALFGIFGAALSVIRPPRFRAVMITTSVALLLWHSLGEVRPFRPNDYELAEWIEENKAPGDRAMYSPPWMGLVVVPKFFPDLNLESGHVDIVPPWVQVDEGETLWVIYSRPGWLDELPDHEKTLQDRGLKFERVRVTEISHTFVYTSLCLYRLDPCFTVLYRIWHEPVPLQPSDTPS